MMASLADALQANPAVVDANGISPLVMIVDDEPTIAQTLSIIFEKSGYRVITEHSATRALRTAQARQPDLLITDIVMPGMSGIELAILFLEAAPKCHTLLLSGHAHTVDLLADARAQGHDFFTMAKPIPPLELLQHAADCLRA